MAKNIILNGTTYAGKRGLQVGSDYFANATLVATATGTQTAGQAPRLAVQLKLFGSEFTVQVDSGYTVWPAVLSEGTQNVVVSFKGMSTTVSVTAGTSGGSGEDTPSTPTDPTDSVTGTATGRDFSRTPTGGILNGTTVYISAAFAEPVASVDGFTQIVLTPTNTAAKGNLQFMGGTFTRGKTGDGSTADSNTWGTNGNKSAKYGTSENGVIANNMDGDITLTFDGSAGNWTGFTIKAANIINSGEGWSVNYNKVFDVDGYRSAFSYTLS